ncbi:MAG TPA: hypothetical protein VGJ15_00380 [Pirellulales bacterium]
MTIPNHLAPTALDRIDGRRRNAIGVAHVDRRQRMLPGGNSAAQTEQAQINY